MAIGLILLATFIIGVVLIMRGQSPIIVLLSLAILWPILAGASITSVVNDVMEKGAESYASTIVVIVFGAWFGQVLVHTGIAESVIRSAIELAGDRPIVVLIVVDLVVALLFTSMYGIGAAIAVGVIVLPILMTIGVPNWLAAASFIMSMISAYSINLVNFSAIARLFMKNPDFNHYFPWLATTGLVFMACTLAMGVVGMVRSGPVRHSSVLLKETMVRPSVPWYAYITPLVPVIVIVAFNWPMVPAFILGIVFALAATWRSRSFQGAIDLFHKAFYDAFPDISTIAALWIICGMLILAGQLPAVEAVFKPVFGPFIPSDRLSIVLFFIILAPIGLYRGPMSVVGTGAALLAIFLSVGKIPGEILFPFWMASLFIHQALDPTNSWGIWTIGYTKVTHREFISTGLLYSWVGVAISLAIGYFVLPLK